MTLPRGMDVSMVTGQPVGGPEEKKDKVFRRFHDAMQESYNLAAEIQEGSPLAKAVFRQYQNRLIALASQDPVCQSLEKVIQAWNHALEVAPVMAEREALRVMGPQIGPLVANEAAPD